MYQPIYRISPAVASLLIRIEAIKKEIELVNIPAEEIVSLRKHALVESTHYSTYIEGNRLTQEEVSKVIYEHARIPGRKRDEHEVLGYAAALNYVLGRAAQRASITEEDVKQMHALVMGGGVTEVLPTHYRDGQNVIRESGSGRIVYLPPEAKDVPSLMHDLIMWIKQAEEQDIPYVIIAAIAHYEFATIHPYYDGNGRVARLLATMIMHRGSYGLKGIYSLEEYYAKDLSRYYHALDIGPSHNYYEGRATADITSWLHYFIEGVTESFEKIRARLSKSF